MITELIDMGTMDTEPNCPEGFYSCIVDTRHYKVPSSSGAKYSTK